MTTAGLIVFGLLCWSIYPFLKESTRALKKIEEMKEKEKILDELRKIEFNTIVKEVKPG